MTAVGKQYIVCAHMRNALTCLYGNPASKFSNVDPPNLEAYFAWISNFAWFITKRDQKNKFSYFPHNRHFFENSKTKKNFFEPNPTHPLSQNRN